MTQKYLTIPQGKEPIRPSIPKNPDDFVYTQDIEDMIVRNEGFHKGWIDVEGRGLKTTGYGFLDSDGSLQKKYPNGMTKAQALYYLKNVEFPRRAKILARDTPNWEYLNNNQRAALFDLHYNIGEGAYRRSKNLRRGLETFDWDLAARNINHGMNSRFRGLRARRLRDQELFRRPIEEIIEEEVKAGTKAAPIKTTPIIEPVVPINPFMYKPLTLSSERKAPVENSYSNPLAEMYKNTVLNNLMNNKSMFDGVFNIFKPLIHR